jgi:hypothetical protein
VNSYRVLLLTSNQIISNHHFQDYMWKSQFLLFFEHFISFFIYLAILASLRLSFSRHLNPTRFFFWRVLTSPKWCLVFIPLVSVYVGMFARSESSPLPWVAFAIEASQTGTYWGIFEALTVIGVDLWLLWIPAHYMIIRNPNQDKQWKWMLRGLNFLAGLILMTPNNPVYWLIDHIG